MAHALLQVNEGVSFGNLHIHTTAMVVVLHGLIVYRPHLAGVSGAIASPELWIFMRFVLISESFDTLTKRSLDPDASTWPSGCQSSDHMFGVSLQSWAFSMVSIDAS